MRCRLRLAGQRPSVAQGSPICLRRVTTGRMRYRGRLARHDHGRYGCAGQLHSWGVRRWLTQKNGHGDGEIVRDEGGHAGTRTPDLYHVKVAL